ncbi:hypothetical protein B0H16DRAFT_1448576 [Mycena metata]|uniref:F-box domain-containing protein n=1 Tax=Mycena metata TaxID=1033252 RepID=A0AAD7KAH2_9AGAR|nr:hypothetical protein B0H16DRAFT_1448576 [Mycena metata]
MTSPSSQTSSPACGIVTAAATLPDEVLSLILLDVVEPELADWIDLINRRKCVGSVSRQWRNVTTGLSVLWSRLYLAPAVLPEFLRECLQKAGPTADLYIYINPNPFPAIYDDGFLREVKVLPFEDFMTKSVDLLRGEFSRVRCLKVIDGEHGELYKIMGSVSRFDARRLKGLDVSSRKLSRGAEAQLPVGMHLDELSISAVYPLWTARAWYDGLTKLGLHDLFDLEWDRLREVLDGNNTLRELQLSDVFCIGYPGNLAAVLPNVARLRLDYHWRGDQDKSFLALVQLPALDYLDVAVGGSAAVQGVARDMAAFLRAATEVWIDGYNFTDRGLAGVVSSCINAQRLNLRRCRPLPYDALRGLTELPTASLPELRVLKITGYLSVEEARLLFRPPFNAALVISECVIGGEVDFREWTLLNGTIQSRPVEDTPDGR